MGSTRNLRRQRFSAAMIAEAVSRVMESEAEAITKRGKEKYSNHRSHHRATSVPTLEALLPTPLPPPLAMHGRSCRRLRCSSPILTFRFVDAIGCCGILEHTL